MFSPGYQYSYADLYPGDGNAMTTSEETIPERGEQDVYTAPTSGGDGRRVINFADMVKFAATIGGAVLLLVVFGFMENPLEPA